MIHWTETLGGHTHPYTRTPIGLSPSLSLCPSFLMKPNQLYACSCDEAIQVGEVTLLTHKNVKETERRGQECPGTQEDESGRKEIKHCTQHI